MLESLGPRGRSRMQHLVAELIMVLAMAVHPRFPCICLSLFDERPQLDLDPGKSTLGFPRSVEFAVPAADAAGSAVKTAQPDRASESPCNSAGAKRLPGDLGGHRLYPAADDSEGVAGSVPTWWSRRCP